MGVVDLGTGPRGLTSAEAATRLAGEGPNALPVQRKTPAWRLLAAEMVHFFALLFWVAGGLAFLAGMPQLGIAVFVVIVLNGLFAFVQGRGPSTPPRSCAAFCPARSPSCATAPRRRYLPKTWSPVTSCCWPRGDRVSADLRLDRVLALAVDTSALTGESVPDHPAPVDHAYAGCFIVEGEAQATVVASGARTRRAGIAKLTQSQRPAPTPLRRELNRVSRIIAAVAIAVGVAFFSIALLLGTPASNGFLFAVGVTVAVVPCGLLPTVTLSHPDIYDFITTKAESPSELTHFNLSVGVTDAFLRAVERDGTHRLVNPRTGKTVARVSAVELFDEICDAAHACGDPGLVFLDTINRANPLPGRGRIEATNRCGEVPLLPYESCNLGSINLARMTNAGHVDWERLADVAGLAVRFLDDVVDVSRYPFPELGAAARAGRKIGLGVIGLAEMLASLGIPYDSDRGFAWRVGSCAAFSRRGTRRWRGWPTIGARSPRAPTAGSRARRRCGTRSSPPSRRPARSRLSPAPQPESSRCSRSRLPARSSEGACSRSTRASTVSPAIGVSTATS